MGKTFRKVILCSTNDHAPRKNDKIRGWVENNGGRFRLEMSPDVTHLITSKNAWKSDAPLVKAARRLRTVKIVNLDWLESSLMSRSRRPLATEKFDYVQRHYRKRKAEAARAQGTSGQKGELYLSADIKRVDNKKSNLKVIEEAGVAFDKACRDFEARMRADGYHLYLDPTHFAYSINLIRNDIHDSRLEQHRLKHGQGLKIRIPDPWAQCLQLFESNSTPHNYTAVSTHLNRNGKVSHDVVAPSESTFNLAKDAFKIFFKLRTGVEWESAPRAAGIKREDSAARERTLSHDGAGDWTYQLEYEVEEWKKGARKPSVTMVVNEEDAGEKWDVRAKTPEGGW